MSILPYQVYQLKALIENPTVSYIFLRGAGGTGKTYAIARFLEHFGYGHHQYLFLGPTGKSISVAEDKGMHGQTIHSWFKILNSSSETEIDKHIRTSFMNDTQYLQLLKLKIADIKIVFIDEVSMVNNEILIHILTIMNNIKPNIKIIFAGDYNQLAAVITNKPEYANLSSSIEIMVKLITSRQMGVIDFITRYRSEDEYFNRFLHNMRQGRENYIAPLTISKFLRKTCNIYTGELDQELHHKLTYLTYTTKEVDRINKLLLEDLSGEVYTFNMIIEKDIYPINEIARRNDIIGDFQMDPVVEFKIGSKIIFRVNNPSGLYKNGDEGIIESVSGNKIFIKKLTHWGDTIIEVERHHYATSQSNLEDGFDLEIAQVPFSLGSARTYHKSQGDGFMFLHLDLNFFKMNNLYNETKWQVFYVGISRIIDPKNVWINESSIKILESQKMVFDSVNYNLLGLVFDTCNCNNGKKDKKSQKLLPPSMKLQDYISRI